MPEAKGATLCSNDPSGAIGWGEATGEGKGVKDPEPSGDLSQSDPTPSYACRIS